MTRRIAFLFSKMIKKLYGTLVVAVFLAGLFLSLYHLTESPPTWMDEGIITQTSRNLAQQGIYAIQTGPQKFVSPGFVTTSYPVTFPVALFFKLFGPNLYSARLVMVIYLISFILLAFVYTRRRFGDWPALATLAFLVSFGPLYGHGKAVLGEVPGLFWFVAFLVFLDKISAGDRRSLVFILAGLFGGLAIVTKPIFLLLVPAFLIANLFLRLWVNVPQRHLQLACLFTLLPALLWLKVQFSGDSFIATINQYINTHGTLNVGTFISNLTRFFTEPQAVYALIALLIWTFFLYRLYKEKAIIKPSELTAFFFSLLIYLAYLRTAGFYRYFFPGEVLTLLFVPGYFLTAIPRRLLAYTILAFLLAGQTYYLLTNSWVLKSFNGKRYFELNQTVSLIPKNKNIFVFQAPEVINFLQGNNYTQYLPVTPTIILGRENISFVQEGVPDVVIGPETMANKLSLDKYYLNASSDRYEIYYRR